MSKFIGRQVSLGVGRETSRGTGVAPSKWIPKTDLSLDDKTNRVVIGSGLGTIEDSDQSHVLTKYAEGDVSAEIRSESFGYILYALLGSLSTAGPTDSAYTHSFSLSNSVQHQSLTLTAIDPNTTDQYALAMLNSLEITQELEDVARFTAGFMAKTSRGASATASFAEEAKFTKPHFSLKFADTVAGLDAASTVSVKSFGLNFTKNLIMDDFNGTAEPEDFNNQSFSVEANMSLNYEGETYKEYMRANTYKAMEVRWTNTEADALIGAATRPALIFRFPRVSFFEWEPNYALDEIVSQNIQIKMHKDVANALSMVSTCQLVNTTTSY